MDWRDWYVLGIFLYTGGGMGIMLTVWYVTYKRKFKDWR